MPVASTVISATVLVAQFLSQVESSPQLQASMSAADGDVAAIVAIANTAGFDFTSADFTLAYQELSRAASVNQYGHPEVYFAKRSVERGHPEVYFADTNIDATIARGHPEVYFAQTSVQRGHPEVYFAQASVKRGHPEVYFDQA